MPTAMLISACEVNQKKPEAICKAKAPEGSRSWSAVSYTHLTLPTIYSV